MRQEAGGQKALLQPQRTALPSGVLGSPRLWEVAVVMPVPSASPSLWLCFS